MDFSNFVKNFLTFFIGLSILALIIFLTISMLPILIVVLLIILIYNLLFVPKEKRSRVFYFYKVNDPYKPTFNEDTIGNSRRKNQEERSSNSTVSRVPSNVKEVEVEVRDPEDKS